MIRISVVVPVYNAERYLPALFESISKQTLPVSDLEIIFVNDGSTDASADRLEEFAIKQPNVVVIHQENSGWAGKPRNVGLKVARGTYVFFADSDDSFGGPEALERLVDFADEHSSDVVIPRMVPKGARPYPKWIYKTTQIDADLETCFNTLTPQKLFRRGFLKRENISFPEGKVRLEDGQMLSRAYFLASRVSIVANYRFYQLNLHESGDHLTSRPKDPKDYIGSVAKICENIEDLCGEEDLGDRIINDLYYRKVLNNFKNSKLIRHSEENQRLWLQCQREFVERFLNERRYAKLGPVSTARTDLVRNGDLKAITDYSLVDSVNFEFVSARSERGKITLSGKLSGGSPSAPLPVLLLMQRGGETRRCSNLPFEKLGDQVLVTIPRSCLPSTAERQFFDLWMTLGKSHPEKRLRGPERPYEDRFVDNRDIVLYTTKHGNLSIEVGKGLSVLERARRFFERLVRR